LEKGEDGYGNSFLLYSNPSLICKQQGMPVGTLFSYNNQANEYSFQTGFIIPRYQSSTFSLCYTSKNHDYINTLSTAAATVYKNCYFGAVFHFHFSSHLPDLSLDGAFTWFFRPDYYSGIIIKDIFSTDTSSELARDILLTTGGRVGRIERFYYVVDGLFSLKSSQNRDYGYGADAMLQKLFFKNPSLCLYVRGKIFYNKNGIKWYTEPTAGLVSTFRKFSFGIYAGYNYSPIPQDNLISLSCYINPLYQKKIPTISCNIFVSEQKSDYSEGEKNILITIRGNFNYKGIQIKRWNLFVTRKDTSGISIIRSFSGGNIPPTTILFDGRDHKGYLLLKGKYYLQLIIVDSMNRVVSSEYKSILIQ